MQVHNRVIRALVLVHDGIRVESDDQVVPFRPRLLQEVEVADVEEIEGAGGIDYLVAGLRRLAVGELDDFLGCGQELGAAGPGRPGRRVLAHGRRVLVFHLVLVRALAEMLPGHQQHAADQVGGGDARCPLYFSEKKKDNNSTVL